VTEGAGVLICRHEEIQQLAVSLLLAFPVLMELLALLSAGQVIPFIKRLAQFLGSF
jgi:hypothetical protein